MWGVEHGVNISFSLSATYKYSLSLPGTRTRGEKKIHAHAYSDRQADRHTFHEKRGEEAEEEEAAENWTFLPSFRFTLDSFSGAKVTSSRPPDRILIRALCATGVGPCPTAGRSEKCRKWILDTGRERDRRMKNSPAEHTDDRGQRKRSLETIQWAVSGATSSSPSGSTSWFPQIPPMRSENEISKRNSSFKKK